MPLKTKIELSVIVPAYKQEKNIQKYLRYLDEVLAGLGRSYEIICVVDGILDKTWQKAKRVRLPNLRVVGYQANQGKGHAVRFGMKYASGETIGFVDAGFDLDYAAIPLALEHMRWYNADIIIGSKRHPASKVIYPWQRRLLSWGYQMGVKILFGINVRDTQVGMKFFKAKVLQKTLPRLLVKTFAFDIEMLAVANRLGYHKIYEFPVKIKMEFGGNSVATKNFLNTAWKMLWDTLAVFYRLRIRHYYDR